MSANGAVVVTGAVVLLVFGLITVVRSTRDCLRQRHVRRAGRAVAGEVTAIDPKYRTYYGLYQLTPIVRYVVDGREHESRVANQSGAADIGSRVDLVVDPQDPDTPFAVYGQAITSTLAVGVGFTVFAVVMGVWALHWS